MRGSWRMPIMDWPNNFDITTSTLRLALSMDTLQRKTTQITDKNK
jgi:hypothetical protein